MNMIVKYNPEGREDLPIELQEELADLETIIEDIMHGWNYCRHDFDWWEFDVSWEKGIWWLAMRERDEYGWSETRVDIHSSRSEDKAGTLLVPDVHYRWAGLPRARRGRLLDRP